MFNVLSFGLYTRCETLSSFYLPHMTQIKLMLTVKDLLLTY